MTDRPLTDADLLTLFIIHKAIRRELMAFASVVPTLEADDAERVEALHRWITFVARTVEIHHRAEEDIDFPMLAARDIDFVPHQACLVRQHDELVPQLDALRQALRELPGASGKAFERERDVLASRFAQFRDDMAIHLDYEEEQIPPRAIAHLTRGDLQKAERQLMKRTPLKDAALITPWVLGSLSGEVYGGLPFVVRLLYQMWWKRRFEGLMRTLRVS